MAKITLLIGRRREALKVTRAVAHETAGELRKVGHEVQVIEIPREYTAQGIVKRYAKGGSAKQALRRLENPMTAEQLVAAGADMTGNYCFNLDVKGKSKEIILRIITRRAGVVSMPAEITPSRRNWDEKIKKIAHTRPMESLEKIYKMVLERNRRARQLLEHLQKHDYTQALQQLKMAIPHRSMNRMTWHENRAYGRKIALAIHAVVQKHEANS